MALYFHQFDEYTILGGFLKVFNIFPNLIWLEVAQVLFDMAQLFVHGIEINVKMKSFYNPKMSTVVLLHWPIGLYYIWYGYANGLMQSWY